MSGAASRACPKDTLLTQFADLGLDKPILKTLAAQGYETPTPIQAQAIPYVLEGRDLLGIAQTGTGKTAAFALPIIQRLIHRKRPAPRRGARCLVLSPTRELASQIADSFRTYGQGLGLGVAVVFGGAKYGPQVRALAPGLDVLVATPGRLLDHLGEKTCFLGETEIFVLDEADQMLDLGFIVPIRKITQHLPKSRQNLFFSATMPGEIGKLAGELLKDPAKVSVAPQATTVERINQQVLFVEGARKRELLVELFANPELTRTIVFTRTKRGADKVAKHLEVAGVGAAAIHGDKSQGQRERALAAFRAGRVRVLVATDIAARGIDVDAVSHVVQFELPHVPESYVHRIGRTARAGADGSAIALVADDERPLLRDIQRVTRQTIPALDRRRDPALAVMAKANKALDQQDGGWEPQPETASAKPRPQARPQARPQGRAPGRPQGHGHGHGQAHGQHGPGQHPRGEGQANRQPRPEGQASRPQGRAPNRGGGGRRFAGG